MAITVANLLEALSKLPPQATVWVSDDSGDSPAGGLLINYAENSLSIFPTDCPVELGPDDFTDCDFIGRFFSGSEVYDHSEDEEGDDGDEDETVGGGDEEDAAPEAGPSDTRPEGEESLVSGSTDIRP